VPVLSRPTSLDLRFSLAGGYDDNVLGKQGNPIGQQLLQSGAFGIGRAGLLYTRHSDTLSLFLGGGSGVRYVPDLGDYIAASHEAFFDLTKDLGRRTHIRVAQNFAYAPFYHFGLLSNTFDGGFGYHAVGSGLLPSEGVGDPLLLDAINLALLSQSVYRYATGAGLTRDLTARSSLSMEYHYARSSFGSDEPLADVVGRNLTRQQGALTYSYRMNQSTIFHAGYGYRLVDYELLGGHGRFGVHDVDLGVDYDRALSLSRSTTISFGTGSAIIVRDRSQAPELDAVFYRLLGRAELNHEMGRTWNANIEYQRGFRFIDGFNEPIFADLVQARLAGSLSTRLESLSWIAYSSGALGFSRRDRAYDTFIATTRLQFALTRHLAAFAQYLFYDYRFHDVLRVPFGLPATLDRQGVQVGMNLWFPLLN
jgi:hypothetical protein